MSGNGKHLAKFALLNGLFLMKLKRCVIEQSGQDQKEEMNSKIRMGRQEEIHSQTKLIKSW